MSRTAKPLPPALKIAVAFATLAPLAAMFIPGAFMVLVAMGLWDKMAPYLDPQTVESLGWSILLPMSGVFVVLHAALVVFYLWHIITNNPAPGAGRILFALGLFIIPWVAMPLYLGIYILPLNPPEWALKATRQTTATA
jgi:hypothetical protein